MKRRIIIVVAFIFSISFCMGQNIQEQKRIEEQQKQAAKERQEQAIKEQKAAEAERLRVLEQNYQNAVASAQENFEQKNYAQAKQDYLTAIELKPQKAAEFNPKITELDKLIIEKAKEDAIAERERLEQEAVAERERLYQKAIESAENNFKQKRYEEAKQDYRAALELKPENASLINRKIAEIDKPATLYIYRGVNRNVWTIIPKEYTIYLDNVVVGNSTKNWKTSVKVTTFGTKKISATITNTNKVSKKAEVQVDFEPGGVYYVRSGIESKSVGTGKYETVTDRNGKITYTEKTVLEYTPILELVHKSIGEGEYKAIKE